MKPGKPESEQNAGFDAPELTAEHEERTLLSAIAGKDRQALERLYVLYHPRLFKFIFRFATTYEQADELVNDVMLVVWTRAHTFRGASRVSTWIFGIAYRLTMKRVSRRRLRLVSGDAVENIVDQRDYLGEQRDWVIRSIDELPDAQRTTVILAFYAGFSYEEIADITSCPLNTVKTRMFHARKKLKDILERQGSPSGTHPETVHD
jgi:RNA polymerase sigma-70 factor (ECF subfamily)